MARDKKKDDEYFNCSEKHEINYVADLYESNESEIKIFLVEKCENNEIKYSTHMEVYQLIEDELGYPIPN